MNNKRKKTIVALSVLLVVLLVGSTIAYFVTTVDFANVFNTGTYKTVSTEEFTAPDNWKPGEEIEKTVTTVNDGTIPAAVRVSYTEKWKDETGAEITPQPTGKVTINLANESDWTLDNGYYYYKKAIQPGEATTSFMKSVTLNTDAISGDSITCTPSADGKSKTCESTDKITGGTYTLIIKTETVQYDAYKEVWNTTVEISKDTTTPTNPISFVNRQNEGSITTGDLLKIGDEEFYVVSSNADKTTLLAHYNLNVGDNKNPDVTEGIQHSSVKGLLPSTSSDPKYGTVAFSTTNYWYNGSSLKSEYGDSYPAYVYDNNSNLYTYVENYKTLLETKGVTISEARLLKHEEAITLGCNASGGTNACASAPSWVYETSYWLGSANDNNNVWYVNSVGNFYGSGYNGAVSYGLRPVIEIPTSEIK